MIRHSTSPCLFFADLLRKLMASTWKLRQILKVLKLGAVLLTAFLATEQQQIVLWKICVGNSMTATVPHFLIQIPYAFGEPHVFWWVFLLRGIFRREVSGMSYSLNDAAIFRITTGTYFTPSLFILNFFCPQLSPPANLGGSPKAVVHSISWDNLVSDNHTILRRDFCICAVTFPSNQESTKRCPNWLLEFHMYVCRCYLVHVNRVNYHFQYGDISSCLLFSVKNKSWELIWQPQLVVPMWSLFCPLDKLPPLGPGPLILQVTLYKIPLCVIGNDDKWHRLLFQPLIPRLMVSTKE